MLIAMVVTGATFVNCPIALNVCNRANFLETVFYSVTALYVFLLLSFILVLGFNKAVGATVEGVTLFPPL